MNFFCIGHGSETKATEENGRQEKVFFKKGAK